MSNTKDTPMDYKQFEGHTPGKRCKMNGEEIYICHIIEGNEALDYEGKCYGCGAKRAISFDQENQTEADAARAYLIREGLDPDQLVKEGLVFIKAVQENVSLKLELQKQKELNAELVNSADMEIQNELWIRATHQQIHHNKKIFRDMKYKPGQKVVCVHQGPWTSITTVTKRSVMGSGPKFNEICIIDGYGCINGIVGYSLVGYKINDFTGQEMIFTERWFEPLVSDEVLEKELNSISILV